MRTTPRRAIPQRRWPRLQSSGGRRFPEEKLLTIAIPGPLRSFARMAALAPETAPEDVLPALARNVVTNGYQAAGSNDVLEQTEYLKLVVRYLSQARELEKLADSTGMIKIETCDSTQTGELLRVLGYRMRGGCGSEVVLETLNATRAFLTIDSGFPARRTRTGPPHQPALCVRLQADSSPDPLHAGLLALQQRSPGRRVHRFFSRRSLAVPPVSGVVEAGPHASEELRKGTTVQRIRAYAHVLDFYGGMFQVRNGKAVVPGGARSEKAWAELVGASPDKPGAFFERLIIRDDGWLASYFDALSRIGNKPANGPVQNYLTDPDRLKRFYAAIRGKVTSPGPARPVFRSNTDMMLLTARLRLDPNGKPHIPGSLEVWRTLFIEHPSGSGKYDAKLSKDAAGLEGSRRRHRGAVRAVPQVGGERAVEDFHGAERPGSPPPNAARCQTADRLAREFRAFGAQYPIFAEVSDVSNGTINQFLDTAAASTRSTISACGPTPPARCNPWLGCGRFSAGKAPSRPPIGIARWRRFSRRFAKVKNEGDVFDGGREGVQTLLAATNSPAGAPRRIACSTCWPAPRSQTRRTHTTNWSKI
jgi:hypothetical protein